MKQNGFTLVELMIVITVIGILAAISMPKFQQAADKAKAAEAPQMLRAIAGAQHGHRLVKGEYLNLGADSHNWSILGLKLPNSAYFNYSATATPASGEIDNITLEYHPGEEPKFIATAELIRNFATVSAGEAITIDHTGEKDASPRMRLLISTFGPFK